MTIAVLVLAMVASIRAEDVDYLRDVKPLLQEKCFACHGALKQESGLRIDTAASLRKGGDSGAVIVSGKPGESLLIDVLTGDAGFRMPPEDEGAPLTDEQIGLIVRWIAAGASAPVDEKPQPDPRAWWSYRSIADPAVPTPNDSAWRASPIDAFIATAREKRALSPRPDAPAAVWLRRVYLDLIGLPPSRDELVAFLQDDSREAREQVVDDLLSRPQYGERWGRHWMDIWRYSDWYGRRASNEIRYSQRHIWRWRDWIVESLNADKGYDQMIREMLAADEIASDDPSILPATGYLGRNWYKFDRNVWLFDTVEKTSEALLGLTMRCSRCHDHKYDPITQQDYYRFRAFFEPHDVRIDPVSAGIPTETDNGKSKVLADGIPRVFDKEIDAKTFLFVRGDGRYPDESNELTPAVPAVFGVEPVAIEPVPLPPGGYYPALRPEVRKTFLEHANERVVELMQELSAARKAIAVAAKKVESAKLTAAESSSRDSQHAANFMNDDFSEPRPGDWQTINGDWVYEDGHLVEKAVTSFATMVTKKNHPANFQVKLRYVPLQPGNYRSIGFSFDFQDKGNSQDVYTSTGDARQSVQAFHRSGGKQVYPRAGIVQTKLKVGEPAELFVTVRGTQLSIDLNGERKLDYVLPIKRQSGKFALWVHNGSAEFHSLQITELTESLDDLERKLRDAQHAAALAELKLKTAQAERDATKARLDADVARHFETDTARQEQLAITASRAERLVVAREADELVLNVERQLDEVRRGPTRPSRKPEPPIPPSAPRIRKRAPGDGRHSRTGSPVLQTRERPALPPTICGTGTSAGRSLIRPKTLG
jgi:mono/diheme cytochrome c family protein